MQAGWGGRSTSLSTRSLLLLRCVCVKQAVAVGMQHVGLWHADNARCPAAGGLVRWVLAARCAGRCASAHSPAAAAGAQLCSLTLLLRCPWLHPCACPLCPLAAAPLSAVPSPSNPACAPTPPLPADVVSWEEEYLAELERLHGAAGELLAAELARGGGSTHKGWGIARKGWQAPGIARRVAALSPVGQQMPQPRRQHFVNCWPLCGWAE